MSVFCIFREYTYGISYLDDHMHVIHDCGCVIDYKTMSFFCYFKVISVEISGIYYSKEKEDIEIQLQNNL